MTRTTQTPNDAAEPPLPSETVRTILSLLIFIHLFAVGAALFGRAMVSSELGRKLANVPLLSGYRQLLDMDLAYAFPLTRAETADVDHEIEATIQLPDGSTQTVVMPDPAIGSGERARHWRQLGLNMAIFLENDDMLSMLSSQIGAGLLRRFDGKDATIQLRGRFLQDPAASARGQDPLRDELLRDEFEARIWLSNGRPQFMKKERSGEAAPAAGTSITPAPTDLPLPPGPAATP